MAVQISVGSTSTPVSERDQAGTLPASGALPQSLYLTETGDSSTISVNDIHQGGIGDCFFLASTGALAQFRPDRISQMIHANADGSFTVDLYVDSNAQPVGFTTSTFSPHPVTVTASFASNSANDGSWDIVGGQKEIWVQVLEKAFAQLYGGYAGIQNGGNPVIATETLTGQPGLFLSPGTLTAASLAQNIASGDLVTFDTGSPSGFGLVANHSYFLEGLQNVGGIPEVQLGNPWGFSQPSLIPVSAIASSFVEIDVGKVGTPAPVPPAPTPAPVTGNTVQLHISEDAWISNAQFVVKVDGAQVGGVQTALASHAAAQSQNFTLSGLTAGIVNENFVAGIRKVMASALPGTTDCTGRVRPSRPKVPRAQQVQKATAGVQRARYMSLETIAPLSDDLAVSLPPLAS